jgi:hypothetical protein
MCIKSGDAETFFYIVLCPLPALSAWGLRPARAAPLLLSTWERGSQRGLAHCASCCPLAHRDGWHSSRVPHPAASGPAPTELLLSMTCCAYETGADGPPSLPWCAINPPQKLSHPLAVLARRHRSLSIPVTSFIVPVTVEPTKIVLTNASYWGYSCRTTSIPP